MKSIISPRVQPMKRRSRAEVCELSSASWQGPATYTPIARLRIAVEWEAQPGHNRGRSLGGRTTTPFTPFAVVIAVLLTAAGTFMATIYLSGLLMQSMQHLQQYNELRAQYSDVWKWQRRK